MFCEVKLTYYERRNVMDQDGWTWEPYSWDELEETKRVHIEYMDWLSQYEARCEDSQG